MFALVLLLLTCSSLAVRAQESCQNPPLWLFFRREDVRSIFPEIPIESVFIVVEDGDVVDSFATQTRAELIFIGSNVAEFPINWCIRSDEYETLDYSLSLTSSAPDVLEHPTTSIPSQGTITSRAYRKLSFYKKSFRELTYHCSAPRKLTATKMDPSCTVSFYCISLQEFLELREKAEKVLAPPLQKGVYPFFTFIDQRADDPFTDSFEQQLNGLSGHGATMTVCDPNMSLRRRKSSGKDIEDDFLFQDDDDFVIVEVRTATGKGSPRHIEEESGVCVESEDVGDTQREESKEEVVREREEPMENGVESKVVVSHDLEEGGGALGKGINMHNFRR